MVILTGCLESVVLIVYHSISITGNESKYNDQNVKIPWMDRL